MKNIELEQVYAEIQNNKALSLLTGLIHFDEYIPFTDSSLNFSSLAVIINDIIINQRNKIVEFGAGTSTILIGKLIKRNKLDAKLLSVEHNKGWYDFMSDYLKKNQLDSSVQLVFAELKESKFSLNDCLWYDNQVIEKAISEFHEPDCVIVDGPPAWRSEISFARYPAFPMMEKYMNNNFSFFLDDTNRDSEKEIFDKWVKSTPDLRNEVFNESFSGIFRGEHFNVRLPHTKFNKS